MQDVLISESKTIKKKKTADWLSILLLKWIKIAAGNFQTWGDCFSYGQHFGISAVTFLCDSSWPSSFSFINILADRLPFRQGSPSSTMWPQSPKAPAHWECSPDKQLYSFNNEKSTLKTSLQSVLRHASGLSDSHEGMNGGHCLWRTCGLFITIVFLRNLCALNVKATF